ncbi:MAG: bifunctional adenosylcobinamide kinase/adenosylcobinamide-phosphate guanylyltransferase [Actinomycetota bacterium]|nr:bifunctional adenosylcobinamide kinase/adenosylcobinamide-phosphate guanylyltransferase [Actinomycetota bacterium]
MIALVLGGSRSGKSEAAERLAEQAAAPVTYVATGTVTDDDMARRIEDHRLRRPSSWETLEAGTDVVAALLEAKGTVLVEALGTWVAAHADFVVDGASLCDALVSREGDTIVVSDEVGLGVHPSTDVGRRFRDALGELNQQVAAVADEVLFVVAGRALRLERP